ncbi:alpha/beta hydrolase [Pseudonocardia humida]|uniref:Alpha/beta hydrolase n=1 Tax=Pseudonocardia humida TaxID=2800819 RepID=A0ABT1AD05_9PSEU|nr:alpha/beta hydrolase [Pseudonocardia humida]MCO1660947.1 alpha/beta hydrolase [Pseudonocardia humida]
MGRSPRRAVAIALLALALTGAGCTVGPSERPPVAVRGENVPAAPTDAATGPVLEELPEPEAGLVSVPFVDCTQDALLTGPVVPPDRTLQVECGEIIVPADPDHPGLGGISLGVQRVAPASARPDDLPPLLTLGDAGVDPSAAHALTLATQVSPAVLQGFAIVGLDRRGSGVDLLDCAPDAARSALVDATVTSEEALADLLEDARDVVQECNLALDGGLASYRTALAASDVEQLRLGLGVRTLSAIGVGDGAAALAEWARSAPTSVGRLVLDGPPYPELDEPDLSESRAGAAEAAFEAFAVACRATAACPLGTDPRAAVTTLVDRLRVQPLAAADGNRLTAGAALTVLLDQLGDPTAWPALAAALAAASNGDPTPLLAAIAPVTGPRGRFDGTLATTCNDTRRRLSPGEIAELTASWRTAYPLFGTALAMRLVACAPWPTSPAPDPVGHAEGAPPILVLGTAADPQGALEGSRRTAEGLVSARFLSWQGAGTGAYPRTPCVTGFVDSMLVVGAVPPSGILCPP